MESTAAENKNTDTISLTDYHISHETGFLPPAAPLTRLPGDYFAPWEDVIAQLPQLNKMKQLRAEVDKLPERDFSPATLKSEEEWRRAYTMLCMLGQSYIWGEGQKGLINKVPKKLAIPWCRVSDHLCMNPVGCYASTTIFNFRLHDPEGPWNSENLCINSTFTGTKDESGFCVTFLMIELAAVPALKAIEQVFDDMAHCRDAAVKNCLQIIKMSVQNIRQEMGKMIERCKPNTFYVDMRPFYAGSKGLDALPQGIVYEGVDTKPRQYGGANAGQSSVIYALDIALGARNHGYGNDFINAMKSYMPQKHREFLEELEKLPSIRDYCKVSGNQELVALFNDTIEELGRFRTEHVIIVTRYIVNQREHSVNPTLDKKGSGGSNFMKLLKKVRNETLEAKI